MTQGEIAKRPSFYAPSRGPLPLVGPALMRLRQFSLKKACCYSECMPRKGKPLPLPLVDPASHPPPGFRAMLIRRAKLKYPEMSESRIARYVGCSPSNVHQVLKSFMACRPIRSRIFRL